MILLFQNQAGHWLLGKGYVSTDSLSKCDVMPVDGFTEGEKTLKEMENLKFFGIIFN